MAAAAAAEEITTTISLENVTNIKFSEMCLQGPCLHTVAIYIAGQEEPIVAHQVIGTDICRMLRVKNKRTGSHFNFFLEREGWKDSIQKAHLDKDPIQIGSYIFTYPKKYKPKEMKPIKLPPVRPRKRTKDDEPSEAGMLYAKSYGIYGPWISLNEAKATVKWLRGGMV